jgi:acetyltransferase
MTARSDLDPFMRPRSVAVIGATERPGSWGSFIMGGLLAFPFKGKIFPVNPNADEIFGLKAYGDVRNIPDPVDLAVLTIPENMVEEALRACGQKGVRGVSIVTAGFGETQGQEGRIREEAMASLARKYNMRLLGPNISGTFNLHEGFNASASPAHRLTCTRLAAVCQGGYAFYDLLAAGHARRLGVGKFIHTGNECDLQIIDFLEEFCDDPDVNGIVMYVEAIRDGRRFLEVAGEITKRKPLVIHKAGRTGAGSRAAMSHTGALAGSSDLYMGVFRQLNVTYVPAMELLLPVGQTLVERPSMKGRRIGIITMGGSWGVTICDRLEEMGLEVPEFSRALQGQLRDLGMPPRASTRNPVDIGAAGVLSLTRESLVEMAEIIINSNEIDALLVHGLGRPIRLEEGPPKGMRLFLELEKAVLRELHALQGKWKIPVILGACHHPSESHTIHELTKEGIRFLQSIDELAWCLRALHDYWMSKEGPPQN